ncbi:MAG: hypothetical protein ACXVRJ_02790 [Gaiellaceae bacterium]
MNGTIRVELACSCDGDDLLQFLQQRGLAGTVFRADDHCELEVRSAIDPDERLRRDFETALDSWLAEHGSPLIPASRGIRTYVLRPPGD